MRIIIEWNGNEMGMRFASLFITIFKPSDSAFVIYMDLSTVMYVLFV